MKKLFLLSVAATLISSLSFAKVFRVNNTPGINANFASTTDAIASALVKDGDTLHIEGSQTTYEDITIDKQLTLIGPGYFLNTDPAIQHNVNNATISSITVTASNVKIYGLRIVNVNLYGIEYTGAISGANNSVISRNYCDNIYAWGTLNNIFINQNILQSGFNIQTAQPTTNLLFTNNLVGGGISANASSVGVIEYNVFGISYYAPPALAFGEGTFSVNGNIIKNTGGYAGSISGTTNTVLGYNMAEDDILPSGSGNQNNVDMTGANIFLDGSSNLSYATTDTQWQLSANSPAKTAGAGGTQIGAFGGGGAYKLNGIPAIPTIYKMSISTAIATGSNVPVTFSSKSNN